MQNHTTHTIKIHQPKLKPKFTNIGYGNPRYNSMVVYDDFSVLASCGSTLRRVDVKNNDILFNKQIGQSQIFQIIENKEFIMIVNFEGLISLLDRNSLQIRKQFYAPGKQIRHSSISDKYIVLSAELNEGTKESIFELYKIEDIINTQGNFIQIKPMYSKSGYYYYPECIQETAYMIYFDDPNPKGKSRTETVMNKKLPIKHKVLKLNIDKMEEGIKQIHQIKYEGQILSASKNMSTKQIFYLHGDKKMTVLQLQTQKCHQIQFEATSAPHCIQAHKDGVTFSSKPSEQTYMSVLQGKIKIQKIPFKSIGMGGNLSIKPFKDNYYLFNEYGLHFYESQTSITYSQNCFDITNCGISLNKDGSLFAVADFGGNVYTFTTQQTNAVPIPLTKSTTGGIPIRTLVWCHDTNKILLGCVGGTLFSWDGASPQCQFLNQLDHTINILRYYEGYIYMGISDGYIHVLHSETLQEVYKFQSHFPIHYESEEQRELFGSMKNYAEIWSIMIYPGGNKNEFYVVSTSEDQTQKVYFLSFSQKGIRHELKHHLKGHTLAVTSVDWKNMSKGIGPIYVTCSDDKIVRFRDPNQQFKIVHQVETSTIKQWHTLTYLCLQPNGHRVAIGSQNGYLFIYDIAEKELMFGQKIHLGGIEGMDWSNGKLITCSSDLCISIIHL